MRELVLQHRSSLVCLQETKLENVPAALASELLGTTFGYDFVPSVGLAGGFLLGWNGDVWSASAVVKGRFFLAVKLRPVEETPESPEWWLAVVYGPQLDAERVVFLQELLAFRSANDGHGPWVVCRDFNLILQAGDKNNGRLDRRNMRRFRAFVDSAHL